MKGANRKRMEQSLPSIAYLVRSQSNALKCVPTPSHTGMLLGPGGGGQWESGSLGKAVQDSAGL